jgi:hypothetical protein
MKKTTLSAVTGLIICSTFTSVIGHNINKNDSIKREINNLPSYSKNAMKHIFSVNGVKDIAAAYFVGMGLTAIHELGHAITAKLFYGSPINVTIGGRKNYLDLGPIKLGGFNPATGVTRYLSEKYSPLNEAIIASAGPVCGGIASYFAYRELKKKKNYPISKLASVYGIFNHTFGIAGLAGILLAPHSDGAQVVFHLKNYFKNN